MAARVDFHPERLGVAVVEEDPDDGLRARGPSPRQATKLIAWDRVLGDEPTEPGVIDFPYERSHRAVIARPVSRAKEALRETRPGGRESKKPGPLPVFSGLDGRR